MELAFNYTSSGMERMLLQTITFDYRIVFCRYLHPRNPESWYKTPIGRMIAKNLKMKSKNRMAVNSFLFLSFSNHVHENNKECFRDGKGRKNPRCIFLVTMEKSYTLD